MKTFLKVFGLLVLILIVAISGIATYINFALPDVGAAPALTIKSDKALIERGEYLANHVAVCMDCHSSRDWSKFGAPLISGTEGKGGEVFNERMGLPGVFYSKNITPHNLSNWTDGEIYRLITTGVTKDGEPIFNLMPYQSYSKMDPEDVKAIIAYLRTLPEIPNDVPESEAHFPINLILRTTPKAATPTYLSDNMSIIDKGKYLFTIAGCGDCHTPKDKGTPLEGMFLAGGFSFGLPNGGIVRSANITPDMESGIGKWTSKDFVKRFKMYADTNYVAPEVSPNTFNTVMPWMMYADMNEEDLEAIFAYLQTVDPISNKVEKFTPEKIAM